MKWARELTDQEVLWYQRAFRSSMEPVRLTVHIEMAYKISVRPIISFASLNFRRLFQVVFTLLVAERVKTTRSNRLKFWILSCHKKVKNLLFFITHSPSRWRTPYLRTDFRWRQKWSIARRGLQPLYVGVNRWKREISSRIQAYPGKAWVYRCSSEKGLFL